MSNPWSSASPCLVTVEAFISSLHYSSNITQAATYSVINKLDNSIQHHKSFNEVIFILLLNSTISGFDDILQICYCFSVTTQVIVNDYVIQVGRVLRWQDVQYIPESKKFHAIFQAAYNTKENDTENAVSAMFSTKTNDTYKTTKKCYELIRLKFPKEQNDQIQMYYQFSLRQNELRISKRVQLVVQSNDDATLFFISEMVSKFDTIIEVVFGDVLLGSTACSHLLNSIERSTTLKCLVIRFLAITKTTAAAVVKAVGNNTSLQQIRIAGPSMFYVQMIDNILQIRNNNNGNATNKLACSINALKLEAKYLDQIQLSHYNHLKSFFLAISSVTMHDAYLITDKSIENLFISNLLHLSLFIFLCQVQTTESTIKSICNKSKLLSFTVLCSLSNCKLAKLLCLIIEHTTSLLEVNVLFPGKYDTTYANEILNAIINNENITTVGLPSHDTNLREAITNYNNTVCNTSNKRPLILNFMPTTFLTCHIITDAYEEQLEKSIMLNSDTPTIILANVKRRFYKEYHTEIVCMLFALNQLTVKLPHEMVEAILHHLFQPISTAEYVKHQVYNL